MTDPTPPPERPLSDQARARIRADLLAHAHEHRSGAPRWLVPAGAAAAVALVAGLGFWAISPGGSETGGLPITGGGDTSSVPSSSAPLNESTVSPVEPRSRRRPDRRREAWWGPARARTRWSNVVDGSPQLALQLDDGSVVLRQGQPVPAVRRARGPDDGPQAAAAHPAQRRRLDVRRELDLLDGHQIVRSAGGIVPAGAAAFDVQYTFPDGHTEVATTVTDDQGRSWWYMAYS